MAEEIDSSYILPVLRLTPLAPDTVDEVLDERQPKGSPLPAAI